MFIFLASLYKPPAVLDICAKEEILSVAFIFLIPDIASNVFSKGLAILPRVVVDNFSTVFLKFLAYLKSLKLDIVLLTAFIPSAAAPNAEPILAAFLALLAVAANKDAPPVKGASNAPPTSSNTASLMIPAVYAKFIIRLLVNPNTPPLLDCPIAAASSYACASSKSELVKSPESIFIKLLGPEVKPLENKGTKE